VIVIIFSDSSTWWCFAKAIYFKRSSDCSVLRSICLTPTLLLAFSSVAFDAVINAISQTTAVKNIYFEEPQRKTV